MLSRTAENLFWMARDMERAENTARMLDVSFRMALLPSTIDKQALHFEPILAIAPGDGRFDELYGELTHETIVRYVALEQANPASIWSLIRFARENARAPRRATDGRPDQECTRAVPSGQPQRDPRRKERRNPENQRG